MTKATYTVTGSTPFDGHEPGETFEADLDEELEARAVERGSISKGKKSAKKEEED